MNKLTGQGGAVAVSPDGRWIALGDGRRLALFETTVRAEPNALHRFGKHNCYALRARRRDHQVATFAPDGRLPSATASKDGMVKLWDATSLVDGHASLFNGRDLTGWKSYDSPPDAFHVENGLLVASGKAKGWLVTNEDYADFDLRLEYRLAPGANSGIAVRAAPQAPASYAMEIRIVDDEHYMTQARDAFRPEMRTGSSLYNLLLAPSLLNDNKVGRVERPASARRGPTASSSRSTGFSRDGARDYRVRPGETLGTGPHFRAHRPTKPGRQSGVPQRGRESCLKPAEKK